MTLVPPEDSENQLLKQQAELADLRARLATAEANLRDLRAHRYQLKECNPVQPVHHSYISGNSVFVGTGWGQ